MIKLKTKKSLFKINHLEIYNPKIHYTVQTLEIIRYKIGKNNPLAFIIGLDNFFYITYIE